MSNVSGSSKNCNCKSCRTLNTEPQRCSTCAIYTFITHRYNNDLFCTSCYAKLMETILGQTYKVSRYVHCRVCGGIRVGKDDLCNSCNDRLVGSRTRRAVNPSLIALGKQSDSTQSYPTERRGNHYMGYVYGVRKFHTPQLDEGYISGMFKGRWYSPRQTARCRRDYCGHRYETAPHMNGLCGINMYKMTTQNTEIGSKSLLAITRGWGKVIEQDKGYRVQKAEIIIMYYDMETILRKILQLDGFKKRGVRGTTDWEYFSALLNNCDNDLTEIPKKESNYGNAR